MNGGYVYEASKILLFVKMATVSLSGEFYFFVLNKNWIPV